LDVEAIVGHFVQTGSILLVIEYLASDPYKLA
jgi:hypothetical protein